MLHPRRAVAALALIPLAAALACAGSIMGIEALALGAPIVAVASLMTAWIVAARQRARVKTSADITVAGDVLRLTKSDWTFESPLRQVRAGWFVPSNGRVEIDLHGGSRISALLPEGDAERLLDAVGASVAKRTLVVPLRGTIGTPVRVLMTATLGVIPATMIAVAVAHAFDGYSLPGETGILLSIATWFAVQAAIVAATVRWLGAPRAIVGADGIRIEHMLTQKFVPYGRIGSVTPMTYYSSQGGYRSVNLAVRGAPAVQLPMIGQSDADVSALVARIEAGRGMRYANDSDEALDRLARGGRSMSDLRKDIESVMNAPAIYRNQHLGRDELLTVLQNPHATAERRLTAAIALSVKEGRAASETIRVAADATASDPVRVVLEKVAAGDVDEASVERAVASDRALRK